MRASFLGLEIQKRSVQMAQKALDVTGNNLSNRDTVGYTRQRLDVYSSYMNMNGIYTTSSPVWDFRARAYSQAA